MKQISGGTTNWVLGAGRRWVILLAAAALSGTGLPAHADDAGTGTRAVRLSYVQGQVQISNAGQEITSQAATNMPVFEGYRITTGQDGQAEIQFEDGSVVRLAPDSGVTLKVLRGQGSSGQAEVVLYGGLGYFELQGGDQAGKIDVGFGDAVVTAGGFTVMRIDEDTPPGTLAVFSGNAHVVQGDSVTLDLHGNESVALNGSNPSQYNLAETIETNSWDQWNSDRDQSLQAESTTQNKATDSFVNSDNPAWHDMNANGNWYDVPGSGFVWSPYMAANAGWDPYGCGQWMMTPQYGYTWVSCYAWGFMPYSCGMWNFYSSFGWGWSPGIGGCNPWWGRGFSGYGGPNIGIAPSGYRPVIRPPQVLQPPRGRLPQPILVNREPKHGYGDHPLRSPEGPVTIAGHVVSPLKSSPGRTTGFVQPGRGVVAGGAASRAIVSGSESRVPVMAGQQKPGYGPPERRGGEGYQQPRGYQAQPGNRAERGYSPPAQHGYAPPAQRGDPAANRGGYSGGARPSGGNYSSRSNDGGGTFHGNGGGGNFHGNGGGANSGGAARSSGGYSGGGGGGGGYHGGGGGGASASSSGGGHAGGGGASSGGGGGGGNGGGGHR